MPIFLAFFLLAFIDPSQEFASSFATSACPVAHRQQVRLRGPGDNPRSWIWSSIPALAMFQSGRGSDYFIILHTRLLDNDTKAIVTSACPNGNLRIIGVRVLTGIHRGAVGFVDVQDAAYPPK